MPGSMWRELETEPGTCPWSLEWDNRLGNRRNHEGPRTYLQEKPPRQFPTLHTFRPRKAWDRRKRQAYASFQPAMSRDARPAKGREVRGWKIHLWTGNTLDGIAAEINPILRGWMLYYGHFNRWEMYPLLARINAYLVRWARRKFKRLHAFKRAKAWWQRVGQQDSDLFTHWQWTRAFLPTGW